MISSQTYLVPVLILNLAAISFADDTVYRYECDAVPFDPAAGWIQGNPCGPYCAQSVEDGRFVLRWTDSSDLVNFLYWMTRPPDAPPASLWVEWRIWSNNPIPRTDDACDAEFRINYGTIDEAVFTFADAAVSFSGDRFVLGLDPDEFHTYRFESADGANYTIAVDGRVFIADVGTSQADTDFLVITGMGGCTLEIMPRINKWDFVRYGTISSGERVVSSDPPAGFVDARDHATLDRFTVTFDAADYVYVSDITVETTGGGTPVVKATRRVDNGEPDTVEIVLDRSIPLGETTRFTMTDGVAVNVVEYTYAPGDANGNGKVDLFDAGVLQNCFGVTTPTGLCSVSDLTRDGAVTATDHAALVARLVGP